MNSQAPTTTPTPEDLLSLLRSHQESWEKRFHLRRIGLFGSTARNEATAASDVDVWVELDPLTPFATVHLKQELEALLQRPVDLVRLRERINPALRQARPLLATSFPDIDWKGAMGFRDVIAHQSFDLDTEQVLVICQEALSGLLEAIRCLEQAARKDPCPMAKAETSKEELVRTIDYGELQVRNDSGVLFFWEAGDALDFQGQIQACGAITGRRKLPRRDRTSGGKRRGRPLKTPPPHSGQTVQIGLVL